MVEIRETFNIKLRPDGLRLLILLIFSLLTAVMVFVFLVGMIGKPSEIESLWFLWLIIIGVSCYSIHQLVWELAGKIEVVLTDELLILKNVNTLIKDKKKIPLNKIESISYSKEDWSLLFIWGISPSGDVKIKYGIHEKRIGAGLGKSDCLHLVKILRSEIRKRSN